MADSDPQEVIVENGSKSANSIQSEDTQSPVDDSISSRNVLAELREQVTKESEKDELEAGQQGEQQGEQTSERASDPETEVNTQQTTPKVSEDIPTPEKHVLEACEEADQVSGDNEEPNKEENNKEENNKEETTEVPNEVESKGEESSGLESNPEAASDQAESGNEEVGRTDGTGDVETNEIPPIPSIEIPPSDSDSQSILESSPVSPLPSTGETFESKRHPNAKVDNTKLFMKTFNAILESKDAKKDEKLKSATQRAIDTLGNSASRDPHVIFGALKLACQTSNLDLKSKAVDLFAKLFDYALFEDEDDRANFTDAAVDVITSCFEGEGTDPELEMQVVRALVHSILLMPTHGAPLLKAVRLIYNVFIFSLSSRNQAVAQGTLTQVIGAIFGRVNELLSRSKLRSSDSALNLRNSDTELTSDNIVTLEALQNLDGDSADFERVNEANLASEKDEDLAVKDAFLIFRAMCKLSVKDLDAESVDMRSHSVRSKLLSLHIIHTILKDNIDIFLSKDVVILSSKSDEQTKLVDAVRTYLCQSLTKNAASPLAPVFELSVEIFWLLVSNLRSEFKMEIPVFWEHIYFPISEMKSSTPHQKRYLLSIIERLCNDSRCIIEFYLNYDCDSNQPNICETIINYLTRLSLLRVDTTVTQRFAYRENQRFGISLYDVSKISNLTSATMSSKPPELDIYYQFPLEYSLKLTSLSCIVAFLRSLYSWAQKGISAKKSARVHDRLSTPNSGLSSQNGSRNTSFVDTINKERDPTDQFDSQKQRKKAFLEGLKRFASKPKKGIQYFLENGFIPSDSPEDIAAFLLDNDSLDKSALGEYMGEGDEKNIAIMHAFVDQMDFLGSSFVSSLRTFLQLFRLPGEGQKIDRYMLKFAERYVLGNPGVFSNADTAYVLAYSTVMLNTDQHSRQVKSRMTIDNFVMNNSGIDDGRDVPREFLEDIFSEIQTNEIKLQSEQQAALLNGDQTPTLNAQSGFFGGRDLAKEAYFHASKEMSTKTETLVKNLGKKLRSKESMETVYYVASNIYHVRSIIDTMWMSILAGLTGTFKEYDEEDLIQISLEGIKLSLKIACMFDLQIARKSFMGALIQFQNLSNIEDIKSKSVEAILVMLDIAVSEGDYLQNSWIDVLTSISQLERLQLIANGIDQDSIPDVSTAKLVNRNSLESATARPSGFFSLFSRETSASQTAAIKFHSQQLSEEAVLLLGRTGLSVAIDKVFTNSSNLSGEGIKDFVSALKCVALEEIESSGNSKNPRMFSLQKVVDICYYNMGRIRLEWTQLWNILGEIFNAVGCNPNLVVDNFALDSLRQLSFRFMDFEELAHFKFQKEFLKPFEYVIVNNKSLEVKDMVVECINNLVMAKSAHIKSGWKTIFIVLAAAAKEKSDLIVNKAFKIAMTIKKDYQEEVIAQDSFADLVTCFTAFAKNDSFQKVGLLSLEVLSKLLVQIAKSELEVDGKHEVVGDRLTKLWFPLLFGFYDIIMRGEELEVRTLTLSHFFDVLHKYGDHFGPEFWDSVHNELIIPIFGVLNSPWGLREENDPFGDGSSDSDKMSFWVSTTLIQALNSLVSLYTHYFDALTPVMKRLLDLLTNCICQENDTIARTGTTCLQDFVLSNVSKFSNEQWEMIIACFKQLFTLTTANELFDLDPLKESNQDGSNKSLDNSSIILKCVLQLLMIETVLELCAKDEFFGGIPDGTLLQLCDLLYQSYNFARTFNEDYDLRVRLWNAGIIERLPNLLKQESMSSAVFINVMFRLYCDDTKAQDEAAHKHIIDSVVPLTLVIVDRFCLLDEANQQKSIATWKPVICEIFEGYIEMDESDFLKHSPELYKHVLRLFSKTMGPELQKAIHLFMARVGDVFIYEK